MQNFNEFLNKYKNEAKKQNLQMAFNQFKVKSPFLSNSEYYKLQDSIDTKEINTGKKIKKKDINNDIYLIFYNTLGHTESYFLIFSLLL